MAMDTKNDLKVGAFALIGIVLFCGTVLMLGADRWLFERRLNMSVHLDQVQGIARGSLVSVAGLAAGHVDEVRFMPGSDKIEVVLSLRPEAHARITEGSLASLKTQGALGDKYILIDPGPAAAPLIPVGGLIPTDGKPDFLDALSSKGEQFAKITTSIEEMGKLLESLNSGDKPNALMQNMVGGSAEFRGLMTEARETFRVLRTETLPTVNNVLRKVDQGQGSLGALINDPSLHTRLQDLVGAKPRNRYIKEMLRESIQVEDQTQSRSESSRSK
jgi:phospholipid/cholesterol/gamma-HCH transport system substrate-binding protein